MQDWRFSVFDPYKKKIKEYSKDGYIQYHKRNNDHLEFQLIKSSCVEVFIILSFSWNTDRMKIDMRKKYLGKEYSVANKISTSKDVNKFLQTIDDEYEKYKNLK